MYKYGLLLVSLYIFGKACFDERHLSRVSPREVTSNCNLMQKQCTRIYRIQDTLSSNLDVHSSVCELYTVAERFSGKVRINKYDSVSSFSL